MRQPILALTLLLGLATASSAQVGSLVWEVRPDGEVVLTNPSSEPIAFDGYTLACEAGCLNEDGWTPLAASAVANAPMAIAQLGPGSLKFARISTLNAAAQLSETNTDDQAVLQPGGIWSFGKPIAGTATQVSEFVSFGALSITTSGGGVVLTSSLMYVPELGSFAMASLCAAGLVGLQNLRKRRPR